jgi:hypothetical protein|tara:strand:+ start:270 stop:569 length:300 start_codon:yes stop_codon:yes gene_type:complete
MHDDDDDEDDAGTKRKRLEELVAKRMRSTGFTQFEMDSRADALEFLFISFKCAGKHHWLMQQLPYLLEPDTMTTQDWEDYIDVSWRLHGLVGEASDKSN